jgi:hypothetical protein
MDETTHRHKKSSQGRRKSKPKFEIPVEAGTPETANGWVYRAETEGEAQTVIEPEPDAATATMNPLLMTGVGMLFLGAGAVTVLSLAALGIMVAPFRYAQNIWTR